MLTKVCFVFTFTLATLLSVDCASGPTADEKRFHELRQDLFIYKFTGQDFPAMFAIIFGISLALIVAVLFVVVGMFSMEPAKDSIIYRMTTTRMKKD